MNQPPIYLRVRVDHEYGDFFVQLFEPQRKEHDGKEYFTHSATFACYTSYGAFGFHWSHMGKPFPEFAAGIDDYYLLGKISKQETSPSKIESKVRTAILEARYERRVTHEQARDAWDELETLTDEYSGDLLLKEIYESSALSEISTEWWEYGFQDYPVEAKQFVAVLWPEFTRQLQAVTQEAPCPT